MDILALETVKEGKQQVILKQETHLSPAGKSRGNALPTITQE